MTHIRLIWTRTAYDCVDNFKIQKDYDREMRGQDTKIEGIGMDLKFKIVNLSDRDGSEMGVEEKYGVDEN